MASKSQVSEIPIVKLTDSVIHIINKFPAGTADFEDVKEQIRVNVRNIRYKQMCRDTAQVIYDMIQAGGDFQQTAESKSVRFFEPDPLAGHIIIIFRINVLIAVHFSSCANPLTRYCFVIEGNGIPQ